jgi:hypothetical protein
LSFTFSRGFPDIGISPEARILTPFFDAHGTALAMSVAGKQENLMVDNTKPTSQFHPYQPPTATPVSERPETGVSSILAKAGIDPNRISEAVKKIDLNSSIGKVREYARINPGKILCGLAAVVIGIGLLRRRSA